MRQNFPIAAAFGEPGFAETDAQIADYVAQQRERPYGSFDGGINGGYAKRTSRSVINTTSLSFGDLTVRNIFGYRKNFTSQLINTGAVGPLTAFGGLPFTLFNAQEDRRREYLSDELHLIGDFGHFNRSEEQKSALQSLMRTPYTAVCL